MVILLAGGTGFIGRHLAERLRQRGHRVIVVRRSGPPTPDTVQGDFTRDLDATHWVSRLRDVEVVVNAVGILRERPEATFDAIHTRGPQALFAACAMAGVRRVIQISALGADDGDTGYFRSKRRADQFLATLPLDWTIVQPSVVYGPGGTSARLFDMLASMPVIAVPGRGRQPVQPIHIDDLAHALANLIERDDLVRRRVALVGPRALELRTFLLELRAALGLGSAPVLPIPMSWMRIGARLAGLLPGSLLDRETLAMLERGNVAEPHATRDLLGREPRPVAAFVRPEAAAARALSAQLQWLLPLLRVSIALVWIWTGIVSLGLYPPAASYQLLARTGVSGMLAPLALYGAALLDLALGIATLAMRRRRTLWQVQMALIVVYTLIITFALPEYWLHPYGPVLKNLPMLAGIYLLYILEPRAAAAGS